MIIPFWKGENIVFLTTSGGVSSYYNSIRFKLTFEGILLMVASSLKTAIASNNLLGMS
jgi:hypothetical protein